MSFSRRRNVMAHSSCSPIDTVDVRYSSLCPWFGTVAPVALRNENLDEGCVKCIIKPHREETSWEWGRQELRAEVHLKVNLYVIASQDLKSRLISVTCRKLSSVQYYFNNRQLSPSLSVLRTIFWALLPQFSWVSPFEVCYNCPFQVPFMIILHAIRSC